MADYQEIPLPDYQNWTCADWVTFHGILRERFTRKDANRVWSQAFNNKPTSWMRDKVCTADENFIAYFKKQGIKFDSNFYSIIADAGDTVQNVYRYLPWVIGIIAGGAVIYGIVKIVTVYKVGQGISNLGTVIKK